MQEIPSLLHLIIKMEELKMNDEIEKVKVMIKEARDGIHKSVLKVYLRSLIKNNNNEKGGLT